MKTAILITARLKSVRLPQKVIKLIKGRPMICHMIDRLKLSQSIDQIIISTSPIEQDNPLVQIAAKENIGCFCGDPEDVLLRMKDAAKAFHVDTIISCTADNPFVDPYYIDKLVSFHGKNNNDYSNIAGLPLGVFSHAISYNALVRVCKIKDEKDTEGWGNYFTKSGLFKCGTLAVDDPVVNWPELRLTVDYPEDFEFISRIFDELYDPIGKVFPLNEIVELCQSREDFVNINSMIKQRPLRLIKLKK